MPVKKVKGAKKTGRWSEDEDSQLSKIDVQYNPDIIDNLIAELTKQTENKCSQLQSDADFMMTSLRQAFHLELIKLPTQVKQMSVKQFREKFNDSMESVTMGAIRSSANTSASAASSKGNHRSSIVHQRGPLMPLTTPAPNNRMLPMQTPSTVLRPPKEGEVILSANGSPLGNFTTTVKKPMRPASSIDGSVNGVGAGASGGSVLLPLTTGEVISITDEEDVDFENMSSESRQETLDKMQNVMENMNKIMSKIASGKNAISHAATSK